MWQLATKWITDCIETHAECNTNREEAWCPTRLLDLQEAVPEDLVRLVETRGIAQARRYVTLSHRWGSNRPYTLCRATRAQLLAGIRPGRLPQAFQDAILIARRLEIRYVWIDSLCIMQDRDDLSDWMREAGLMDRVYANSFLNISAVAATDSSHTLFAERHPELIPEARVSTTLHLRDLALGSQLREYRIIDTDFW